VPSGAREAAPGPPLGDPPEGRPVGWPGLGRPNRRGASMPPSTHRRADPPNQAYRLRKVRRSSVGTGLAAIGGALAIGLVSGRGAGRALDRSLHRFLNRSRGPGADAAFKAITELGSLWAAAAASAVLAGAG